MSDEFFKDLVNQVWPNPDLDYAKAEVSEAIEQNSFFLRLFLAGLCSEAVLDKGIAKCPGLKFSDDSYSYVYANNLFRERVRSLANHLGQERLIQALCEAFNRSPDDVLVHNLTLVFDCVEQRNARYFLRPEALAFLKRPAFFIERWRCLFGENENVVVPGDKNLGLPTPKEILFRAQEEQKDAYLLCLQGLKEPSHALAAARGLKQLLDLRSREGILEQITSCSAEVQFELSETLSKLGVPEDAEILYPLLSETLAEEVTGSDLEHLKKLFNLEQETKWLERLEAHPQKSEVRGYFEDNEEAQILERLYAIEDPHAILPALPAHELKLFFESLSWNSHFWQAPPLLKLQKVLCEHPDHGVGEVLAQFNDLIPELPLLNEVLPRLAFEEKHFWALVFCAKQGDKQARTQLSELDIVSLNLRQQEALCRLFRRLPDSASFFRRLMDLEDRPLRLLALRLFKNTGLSKHELDQIWQGIASDDADLIRTTLQFLLGGNREFSRFNISDHSRLQILLARIESWDSELMQACPFHNLLQNLDIPAELLMSEKDRLLSLIQNEAVCPSVRKALIKCLPEFAEKVIPEMIESLLQASSVTVREQVLRLKAAYFKPTTLPQLKERVVQDAAQLRLLALKLIKHLDVREALWVAQREVEECALVRQGMDYHWEGREFVY